MIHIMIVMWFAGNFENNFLQLRTDKNISNSASPMFYNFFYNSFLLSNDRNGILKLKVRENYKLIIFKYINKYLNI